MSASSVLVDYLGAGVAASRPATPTLATGACGLYYATDTTTASIWDGSAWHTVGGGGAASWTWTPKSADYTITTSESGVLVDATSANITITLPTAVSATQPYTVKKKDSSAHTVTVTTTSAQTIDGASTFVLTLQNESITVGSNNSNWYIA